jgi:Aminoacyl tRNA synthetase class II, N-terminal domain
MSTPENKTALPLVHLGITGPAGADGALRRPSRALRRRVCVRLRRIFLETIPRRLARPQIRRADAITDKWLKPATQELKRVVGQDLNQLRAHVESKIEERRKAIEAKSKEQRALIP